MPASYGAYKQIIDFQANFDPGKAEAGLKRWLDHIKKDVKRVAQDQGLAGIAQEQLAVIEARGKLTTDIAAAERRARRHERLMANRKAKVGTGYQQDEIYQKHSANLAKAKQDGKDAAGALKFAEQYMRLLKDEEQVQNKITSSRSRQEQAVRRSSQVQTRLQRQRVQEERAVIRHIMLGEKVERDKFNRTTRHIKDVGGSIEKLGSRTLRAPLRAIGALESGFQRVIRTGAELSVLMFGVGGLNVVHDAIVAPTQIADRMGMVQSGLENAFGAQAPDMMSRLKNYILSTPFQLDDITRSVHGALALGFKSPEAIDRLLQATGNAAVGSGQPDKFDEILQSVGRINIQPRVMARQLQDLQRLGIRASEYLAEGTGRTPGVIDRLARTGQLRLSGKQAAEMIIKGMENDPVFKGAIERMMDKTLTGNLNRLADTVRLGFLLPLGQAFNQRLAHPIKEFVDFLKDNGQILQRLSTVFMGAGDALGKIIEPRLKSLRDLLSDISDSTTDEELFAKVKKIAGALGKDLGQAGKGLIFGIFGIDDPQNENRLFKAARELAGTFMQNLIDAFNPGEVMGKLLLKLIKSLPVAGTLTGENTSVWGQLATGLIAAVLVGKVGGGLAAARNLPGAGKLFGFLTGGLVKMGSGEAPLGGNAARAAQLALQARATSPNAMAGGKGFIQLANGLFIPGRAAAAATSAPSVVGTLAGGGGLKGGLAAAGAGIAKAAPGLGKAGGLLKKVPGLQWLVLGWQLIDAFGSPDEQKGKKLGSAFGSFGGALGGAALGATVGSVVPIVGTAIGGIAGGILGGLLGDAAGGLIGEGLQGLFSSPGAAEAMALTPIGQMISTTRSGLDTISDLFGKFFRSTAAEAKMATLDTSAGSTGSGARAGADGGAAVVGTPTNPGGDWSLPQTRGGFVDQALQSAGFVNSILNACGPILAAGLAKAFAPGLNLTTVDFARYANDHNMWDPNKGFAGADNWAKMFEAMTGLPVQFIGQDQANQLAAQGTPFGVSTPNHYFLVSGVDPKTGKLHVGNSGMALKGGTPYMSWAEIAAFGGVGDASQLRPFQVMGPPPPQANGSAPTSASGNQEAFIRQLLPYATAFEAATGIPAAWTIAMAANETGWGGDPNGTPLQRAGARLMENGNPFGLIGVTGTGGSWNDNGPLMPRNLSLQDAFDQLGRQDVIRNAPRSDAGSFFNYLQQTGWIGKDDPSYSVYPRRLTDMAQGIGMQIQITINYQRGPGGDTAEDARALAEQIAVELASQLDSSFGNMPVESY